MRKMHVGLLISAALILLFSASPIDAGRRYSLMDESAITTGMLEQILNQGMLLLVSENKDGSLRMITSGILINRPPEEVYNVITDFDKYKDFMPSTEEARVVRREGNVLDIYYKIKFTFSVLSYTVEYVLRNTVDPGKGIRWDLVEGDIADTYGSWEFIPIAQGTKTAAIYSVYTDIRSISRVIRYFIEKEPSMDIAINASGCAIVLKTLKKRIEGLCEDSTESSKTDKERKPDPTLDVDM